MSKHHLKQVQQKKFTLPPRVLANRYVAVKHCRHGLMMYNLNDRFVGHSLDLYGEWCEAELACLGQLIHAGDVVLDIGANIGTHTVFFAKAVTPGGIVIAFEPQRITYEFLCANLALNGLLNVLPKQTAVGDRVGEILIPVLDPNIEQNFAQLNIEGHAKGDPVPLVPIDSLELKRCNLIKIDVEGMELPVLHGAQKTIRQCRPFMFVENNTPEGAPETVQTLFDLGYNCWWHIANYYSPINFFNNPENVFATLLPESNMICIPKEHDLKVTGFEPVIAADDTWVKAATRLGLIKAKEGTP